MWEVGPCGGLQLTDNGGGGVDDGAGHMRGGVPAGDEEQLEGEVLLGGRVLHLQGNRDLLAFRLPHQPLHLAVEGAEFLGLVPGLEVPGLVPARGRRVSWAGGTVVADTEDQRLVFFCFYLRMRTQMATKE